MSAAAGWSQDGRAPASSGLQLGLAVNAFDDKGEPFHKRGISAASGIYFLGLPNLVNRASSFIYGVWHDAKYIADHIVQQRGYLSFDD